MAKPGTWRSFLCSAGTGIAESGSNSHCPGRWQIRVMEKNVLARKFWESSIVKFTGQPAQFTNFVKDGVVWHRFSLDSRR